MPIITLPDYLNLDEAVYTTGGAVPTAPSGWKLIANTTTANGMQALGGSGPAVGENPDRRA